MVDKKNNKSPYISVVIPVYNEEENIIQLCEAVTSVLDTYGKPYEILLINDGSTDRTLELITQVKNQRSLRSTSGSAELRVLSFERNAGQTAGFDAGFKAAKGEIIVTMDGDMQNDPRDIPVLIDKLVSMDCDGVVGWRRNRQDTLLRRIVSYFGNKVRNKLTGDRFKDTGCSLKALKSYTVKNLKLYNGMHRFLSTLINLEGFRLVEVPVNHFPRTRGKSKYSIMNRIFKVLMDILILRWMRKRHLNYKISKEA